ncbi:hypothetical protein K3495_g7679 [Podosphaera aphanis]|nr:hypothetical protein K3495_g7679 [Podosphaera aphanis]
MGEPISSPESNRSTNDVVLDTGATHHVFCDLSAFVSLSPVQKSIQTASGHHLNVTGIGSVVFRVFDFMGTNKSKVIKVDNVWHVPDCTKNLFSGTQLLTNGFGISSSQMGLSVTSSTGSVTATARPVGGLIVLFQHISIFQVQGFRGFCGCKSIPITSFQRSVLENGPGIQIDNTSSSTNVFRPHRHPMMASEAQTPYLIHTHQKSILIPKLEVSLGCWDTHNFRK